VASKDLASALVVIYLLPYCAVASVLLLVGATLDRLPVVPDAAARWFDRVLMGTVFVLARPADAWPAPGVESTGDTTD